MLLGALGAGRGEQPSYQHACDEQLTSSGEATGAMPASPAVEQFRAAGARQTYDVFDVRQAGGKSTDRGAVEHTSSRGEEPDDETPAQELERPIANVAMRHTITGEMKRDAEAHAAEDKARRELVDLKNRADATVIQTRKSLEEHGGKVTAEVRGKIESALSNLEGKIKTDDKDAIQAAMTELDKAAMELGKILYEEASKKGAAPGGAAPGGEAKAGGKDDVIDAEYKVKDEG